MQDSTIADDVYFLLTEGAIVTWTESLEEAREWERDKRGNCYKRYSANPRDRKPFERVQGDEFLSFDEL